MSRGRVGPNVVRARSRSSNNVDVGGTQKKTLVEVQRDAEVGTKHSNQSPKRKHDAKVEGAQQICHESSYNYGRQIIKACERSEQCNNL